MQVKLNMVVMKGVNEQELPDFVALTKTENIEVRFIEFMPFAANRWTAGKVYTKQEILQTIANRYEFNALPPDPHGTSSPYRVQGFTGTFAVISTMSAPFCAGCNRMRLTADGKMKSCLFSKGETDLLSALRSGRPLSPLIRQNVLDKAEKLGGQFGDTPFTELHEEQLINRSMISIGG